MNVAELNGLFRNTYARKYIKGVLLKAPEGYLKYDQSKYTHDWTMATIFTVDVSEMREEVVRVKLDVDSDGLVAMVVEGY
jgi:hypothetical protein